MPIGNLMSAVGLLIISIIVAVNGGRFAAHREVESRILNLRGAPAIVLGAMMLAAGLAGAGFALYVGLRLGE